MQQGVNGYDVTDTDLQLAYQSMKTDSKLKFVSYDCEKEAEEKAKQLQCIFRLS